MEVSGLLLYAKTDEAIIPDNEYKMSGNTISVKTLDLSVDFSKIEEQLHRIVKGFFVSIQHPLWLLRRYPSALSPAVFQYSPSDA